MVVTAIPLHIYKNWKQDRWFGFSSRVSIFEIIIYMRSEPRRLQSVIYKCITIILFLIYLVYIGQRRVGFSNNNFTLWESFLFNDYYAPYHMLYAAMHYKYIDFFEVFRSNLFNTFIGLGYPYLQTELGNLVREGSSTRSAGFAFFIFTEDIWRWVGQVLFIME